jgi:tetratricopeptide (TPR) repeat protein
VLSQLTGDVEAELARGAITPENAGRLRKLLVLSGEALVEVGPDLVGIFVPGVGLATRVAAFAAEKVGWLEKLERLAGRQREEERAAGTGIDQSHIFEQYTNVLKALAVEQPLMLVLDDLQWADGASIDLLFRLGRRIGESPILIVGTYRPDEVALGRPSTSSGQVERHPLEKVLAEFKRYFGDVRVDLAVAQEDEGVHFVDALVDTEPNQLGGGFRQALHHHTGGHPLFTIELLRDMQERGDLVQDEAGRWMEGPVLDWQALPARVEGVIEERIGRLERELREALSVASVEGEDFTAEVVAGVQAADARGLIRRLSGELEKQHRLVNALGIRRMQGQRLSLYRFQHNLFQTYLYNALDKVERAVLHEDVGTVLEELYGNQSKEVAVQLARHFEEAGIAEKARVYLRYAGEQASARFANDEAIDYFGRALELAPEDALTERYDLLLAREKITSLKGEREVQAQDLAALEALAEALDDGRRRAEVALRRAKYANDVCDYSAAVTAAQVAVRLAPSAGGASVEAKSYREWGRTLYDQGEIKMSQTKFEKALTLAKAAGLRQVEARIMRNLGLVADTQGDYITARARCEEALHIFREIGDRRGESGTLNNLGVVFRIQGDYAEARSCFKKALPVSRKVGDRRTETILLGNLGVVAALQGDLEEARTYFEQCRLSSYEIGDRKGEVLMLCNLGEVCALQGDLVAANRFFEQALHISREIGYPEGEANILNELGHLSTRKGDYTAARAHYEASRQIARETGMRQFEGRTLASLSLLYHRLGQDRVAREFCYQALSIAQELGDRNLEASALTRLGHTLTALDHLAEAATAYAQALTLRRELAQAHLEMESLSDLARASLAQNELAQAQTHVEEILGFLEDNTLDGTDEPFRVYLTCYRVLHANQDPRAQVLLTTAHGLLQDQAAKIEDEGMRRSFLENVLTHREIVREFASTQ